MKDLFQFGFCFISDFSTVDLRLTYADNVCKLNIVLS